MRNSLVYALGFTAQILFSARLLAQWISSERAKQVRSPVIFWQLSLTASFLFIIYGILRQDVVIVGGQILAYFIYLRNLQLHNRWSILPGALRRTAVFFPFLALAVTGIAGEHHLQSVLRNDAISTPLLIWGSVGQVVFTFRFVYQWYWAERSKSSVFPAGFWVISIVGSAMVLIYALFRRDPVLIAGQLFGSVVYGRNIVLHYRHRALQSIEPSDPDTAL